MEPAALQPTKKWYKTKGGIITIAVLGLIAAFILVFIAMTGYYLWVAAYGDAEEQAALQERFGQSFTAVDGSASIGAISEISVDPATIIRSHNPQFGNADAAVTVIAFIDFECPFCRQSFPTFEEIRARYSPAVNIVFKHAPLESIHPHAGAAARASQCAHEQGAFWEFYKKLFERQVLNDSALREYGAEIGLAMPAFERCLADPQIEAQVAQDLQDAFSIGLRGTPTYLINKTKLEGSTAQTQWNEVLVSELSKF